MHEVHSRRSIDACLAYIRAVRCRNRSTNYVDRCVSHVCLPDSLAIGVPWIIAVADLDASMCELPMEYIDIDATSEFRCERFDSNERVTDPGWFSLKAESRPRRCIGRGSRSCSHRTALMSLPARMRSQAPSMHIIHATIFANSFSSIPQSNCLAWRAGGSPRVGRCERLQPIAAMVHIHPE